jgi:hypothetical protein
MSRKKAESPDADGLSPLLRQLVALMGRRADDPAVVAFVTETLGQKVPASTTDVNSSKYVVARKQGLELLFSHDILNEMYPLIPKGKSAFVPYLSLVRPTQKFPEPLPFGVALGMSPDELTAKLGVPPHLRGAGVQYWRRVLDPERDVILDGNERGFTIMIDSASELSGRHGSPARPVVGLFVAWLIARDLLDESRFAAHAELIAAIRRRERQGTALVDAALPRGLWDDHLRDRPGLRHFAYAWFHNIKVGFIRDDLVGVFGSREGPTGHAEPVLDDDDWAAVDRATPVLDERFGQWVR